MNAALRKAATNAANYIRRNGFGHDQEERIAEIEAALAEPGNPLEEAIRQTQRDIASAGMLPAAAQLAAILPLQSHLTDLLKQRAALLARMEAFQPPAEPQAQGGGEVPEAELIALVAGPYHYHHKMDEAAEREGKAFDRCRELTIQNIRTWCATRRAMLRTAPPSAPVGVAGDTVGLHVLTGVFDKHGEELRAGDRIVIRLEGEHTKPEYWNPEYVIAWAAPRFTLRHVGGGLDSDTARWYFGLGTEQGYEKLELLSRPDAALAQQRTAVDEKYAELIYAVASKYPGESRHETALRYIRQAESADHGDAQAATQSGGSDNDQ